MQTVGAAGIPACGIAEESQLVMFACSAAGRNARSSYN